MTTTALPDMKPEDHFSIDEVGHEGKLTATAKGGTPNDDREMHRMGKAQELRRNFKFLGIVGFVSILQSSWEGALQSNYFGLYNGGRGGIVWCTVAVWLFMLCLLASMAEMASMAPTAGGQYHWVSEFAPRRYQGPLSYVVGWCCCLGWISGIPACGTQLAGLVQAMILLVNPDAQFAELWQITLLLFLFLLLTVGFNIFFAGSLPLAEGIVLFLHVFAFFAFLLTLWIMADHAPASEVFTTFRDPGWGSQGLSCLVGLTSPIWCFIGPDAGAHMSEELKDASRQLPKAMMWATIANGVMGIAMIITFCFCITDLEATLGADTNFPIINIIHSATGSNAGTCVLGSVLVILLFFSTVTTIASASRQTWAFSRDQGFPFSDWIRYVPPNWEIPLNALLVCLGVSLILGAINFGSEVAFNAITSISNAALIFSYIISIGCVRLKRLRGEPVLPRRWSLGKWGGPINDLALAFLFVGFVFAFFPQEPSVGDPEWAVHFNWAIIIFAGICLLAFTYYLLGGRKRYVAPVSLVKQE
ncbi:hypothetical protein D0860_06899 [Hortaea werneckii]|uniref:Amino acid permease/ SLC12A domain-containing protein n=1 Tax=Hortaea werneckii TaxID=91943 RepID=A0A3M7GPY5_HORWE|nr:hypothetical protein D0860_06899 [Hortaea werneckii]